MYHRNQGYQRRLCGDQGRQDGEWWCIGFLQCMTANHDQPALRVFQQQCWWTIVKTEWVNIVKRERSYGTFTDSSWTHNTTKPSKCQLRRLNERKSARNDDITFSEVPCCRNGNTIFCHPFWKLFIGRFAHSDSWRCVKSNGEFLNYWGDCRKRVQ